MWLGKEQCAVTWEPAENIPREIIDEFERGISTLVSEQITSSGLGQDMHTLMVEQSHSTSSVPSSARTVISGNEGLVNTMYIT